MEAAIRNALDRAGNPDAATRARIYQSARQALSRSLERQGITDPALVHEQGQRLEQLIAHVEAERAAAPVAPPVQTTPAAPSRAPEVASPRQTLPPAAPVVEPAFTADRREPSFGAGPAPHAPAPEPMAPEPDDGLSLPPEPPARAPEPKGKAKAPKRAPRRKRHGLHLVSGLFSAAVILSFVAMAGWWLVESGALLSPAERDTSVPNPPPTVKEEDFEGAAPRQLNPGAGFTGEWRIAFSPTQQGGEILTSRRAQAEFVGSGEGRVLRIVSTAGDGNGEVKIPIDTATLAEIAAQNSVVALTLKSLGNEATQIYLRCDFPGLGDCGRRRFDVGTAVTDVLFDLELAGKGAPSRTGHLIINGDISGTGHGVDLYAVRVRPAD
jgi:hypothetical protein